MSITPCIRVCRLANEVCTGCGRTVEQIRNWSTYDTETRLKIMLLSAPPKGTGYETIGG